MTGPFLGWGHPDPQSQATLQSLGPGNIQKAYADLRGLWEYVRKIVLA